MGSPAGSARLVVAAFLIVGPYVGGLISVVWMIVDRTYPMVTAWEIALSPVTALMGYPMGLPPALVTGLVAALTSSRVRSKILWLALSGLVGGLSSVAFFATIAGTGRDALVFLPIGAVSALAAGGVALGLRPRWSN